MTMILRWFRWPQCEETTAELGPCIRRRWHDGPHLDPAGARWERL